MTLYDEQIEREKISVTRGIARMKAEMVRDTDKGRAFDNNVGQAMVRRLVERSVESVQDIHRQAKTKVRESLTTGRRLSGWEHPLLMLDVDTVTFIAIKTLCSSMGRGMSNQQIAKIIGDRFNDQVNWLSMRQQEKERTKQDDADPGYNRVAYLKKEVKQINPKSVRKWMRRLDDLSFDTWDTRTRISLGLQLIQAIMEVCPDIFEEEMVTTQKNGKFTKKLLIKFSERAEVNLAERMRGMGSNSPWLTPMISRPNPWERDADGSTIAGGYLTIKKDFVKGFDEETYGDRVPDVVLQAINTCQDTAWTVNEAVLVHVRKAVANNVEKVLPVAPRREQLTEVPAAEWEAMSPEARREIKFQRKEIHDNNFRLESKRQVISRQLEIAEDLAGRDFYFPHVIDWRGRAYPLPQDFHPQSDDMGKALMMFSEAKPLGQQGFLWLQYQVANTYGCDKMTRDEQLDWCHENISGIKMLAANPFGVMLDWWATAEEPWAFLASCLELVAALDHGGDDYECALPIHVDGSCNGLQHLSAMGKDPVGAKAVNLMPGPRQDIYQIVADKVARRVEVDAARCEDERWYDQPACKWNGKVTRKVVKRGVMTKPYGLTHVGMRDQLLDDREACWPTVEGDPMSNATYMRDLMAEAIEDTVHASVHVMDWFQDVARLFAEAGHGVSWTAPTGFRCTQYYPNLGSRVYTVCGVGLKSSTRRLRIGEVQEGIRKGKQVQSIAPNIVHSFDGAHMQLAIVQSGVTAVSAVHDSFGCHACDMDGFLAVIKDTFMAIYREEVLLGLYREFKVQADALGIEGVPVPPDMGTFDVEEVEGSDFFFA